ncbi:AraC family transcriptional regulator [Flavihumibacter solisilvae]|uniref:HTH araC/xylS-type domain-containing protein n=1 Tax=Flavihumibacter solisilvae TaxID=1349421 RepID=A0A0C1L3K5_9BACT|nr:AraC family transcriptional regulator [Flavihumibacter solisilvae]KIC94597.1 hypothetical protein OI18_10865 [Flavihumibacter solisilvae]
MKPALEYLPRESDHSFVVKYFDYNYYPTPWHYHPEYEIVMVTESTGKRFIGDAVSDFEPGNLAFIGPNIPHTYKNDDRYYEDGSGLRAKSIVIHFTEASLGTDFLALPESRIITRLFDQSLNGIEILGKTRDRIATKLHEIVELKGMRRWLCLVDILTGIAESKECEAITNASVIGFNEKESRRLCNVLDWITNNFENNISLSDAARVAQMNDNAFSRFFSQRTRKTFSSFVQELRLQKAAKLLIENEMTVTEVCYECGYNNISNFNRQFLQQYQLNPLRYRKLFCRE